jgi:signal transduction histidine kinase
MVTPLTSMNTIKKFDDTVRPNYRLEHTLISSNDSPFKINFEPAGGEHQHSSVTVDLHGVAHEIRNPLANIKLALHALSGEIKNPDLLCYLDIIARSAKKIDTLLLDLLRPSPNNSERTSVQEAIQQALTIIQDRIELNNVQVTTDIDTRSFVLVNRNDFVMALTNIILNGVEAINHSNGKVSICAIRHGDKTAIHITDNGIGISKSDLKNIFLPAFSTKPGGSGIGLAITRNILEKYKATVEVKSKRGKGTTFTVILEDVG